MFKGMAEAEKYIFKASCGGFLLQWEYGVTHVIDSKKQPSIVVFLLKTVMISLFFPPYLGFVLVFYKIMWYLIYKNQSLDSRMH